MEENKIIVEGKFGVELSLMSYVPKEVKGVIQILHGMGEYKERYKPFMKWLADKGYAVYIHDHRKHGESVDTEFYRIGQFTEADHFEYLIDDAHYVARKIKEVHPDAPFIMMGHSMGSIILRRYLQKFTTTCDLAILSGTMPVIKKSKTVVPKLLAKIIKVFKKEQPSEFMFNIFNKSALGGMKNPVTPFDWISHEDKLIDKYIKDEGTGFAYSAQFYIEFLDMCVKVNKSELISEGKDIPILFISGKDDPVGEYGHGVKEVHQLYNSHGYFQLTIKLIQGWRHEILDGKGKNDHYRFIDEWITSYLEK